MEELRKHLDPNDTTERCGVILKSGEVIETKNIHPEPEHGFEIPCDILLSYENDLIGTWHTHPQGSSVYSMMDHNGFLAWPHLTHWIIGKDSVSSYIVKDGIVLNAD